MKLKYGNDYRAAGADKSLMKDLREVIRLCEEEPEQLGRDYYNNAINQATWAIKFIADNGMYCTYGSENRWYSTHFVKDDSFETSSEMTYFEVVKYVLFNHLPRKNPMASSFTPFSLHQIVRSINDAAIPFKINGEYWIQDTLEEAAKRILAMTARVFYDDGGSLVVQWCNGTTRLLTLRERCAWYLYKTIPSEYNV